MSKDHKQGSFGLQEEGRLKLDHQTRNAWLDRDEGLNARWKASGMTRDDFIEHNHDEIDMVIAEDSKRA
jgi:hypothetical protein